MNDSPPRRFIKRFIRVMDAVAWLWLVLSVGSTFTVGHERLDSAGGAATIALVAAFVAWWRGMPRLLHPSPHAQPVEPAGWRGLLILGGLVAITLALIHQSGFFVSLMWMVMGMSFALLKLQLAIPSAAITFGLAGFFSGMFPQSIRGGQDVYQLVTGLLVLALWVAMGVTMHRLISTWYDNTRLIKQLNEAQDDLRRRADTDRENAVLRERTRLARDMHDGLGHALTLIAVKAEAAQRLQQVNPERARAQLEQIKEVARDSMQDLKRSVASLRSPILYQRLLSEALDQYASDLARQAGWQLTLDLATHLPLPADVEETIWRTAQEALTNVLKHAQAAHVVVRLTALSSLVRLSVQDDGIGLPAAPTPEGHYGLRGMHERASALGGGLSIASDHGRGTTVTLELPLRNAATEAEGAGADTLAAV